MHNRMWSRQAQLPDSRVPTQLQVPQGTRLFEDINLSACTLHVPAGTKALYEVADVWKEFGTILEAGDAGAQAILPSFEVYASGGTVYINSPVSEQIDVYSMGGALLHRRTKPAGSITIENLPKGVLIISGSSGWVRKMALLYTSLTQ
jgi:hypothetical protein